MNINLIRKQLVCLLLLGAMSVSVAGNKKVFNAAAGKYDCTLDGSYTVNTGTISEYFLDGTAALMRLPRGKGKGKTKERAKDKEKVRTEGKKREEKEKERVQKQ